VCAFNIFISIIVYGLLSEINGCMYVCMYVFNICVVALTKSEI